MAAFADFAGYSEISKQLLDLDSSGTTPDGSALLLPPPPGLDGLRNLFKSTQSSDAAQFNKHPAVQMILEYMRRSLDWSWRRTPIREDIFAGRSSYGAPDPLSISGIDDGRLKSGAQGLLMNAIYNSTTQWDDNIDNDRALGAIKSANDHIWDNKLQVLIRYFQYAHSVQSTADNVRGYTLFLTSKAYRTLKMHQGSTGAWPNSNLEMFCHFAKLAACGASDEEIKSVYRTITQTEPKIDPGYFSEVTGESWKQFERWLTHETIGWSDLGCSDLGQSKLVMGGVMNGAPITVNDYLAEDAVRHYGYWKDKSISCFDGRALVVMASGEKQRLDQVRRGDRILGKTHRKGSRLNDKTAEDELCTVLAISTPKRAGRSLYSFKDAPDIRFSSTHPVILPENNAPNTVRGLPVLSFVDKHGAASSNPTWRAFETAKLDLSCLEVHTADAENEDERLYDLLLQADEAFANGVPRYVLESSSGRQVNVMSEAPLAVWYPQEFLFVANLISAVVAAKDVDVQAILHNVHADNLGLNQSLRDMTSIDLKAPRDNLALDVDLATLMKQPGLTQGYLDLMEIIVARLGRAITRAISRRQAIQSMQTAGKPSRESVVFDIGQLQRLDGSGGRPLPRSWSVKIDGASDSPTEHSITGDPEGVNVVSFADIMIPVRRTSGSKGHILVKFKINDEAGQYSFVGGCPLQKNVHSVINMIDVKDPTGRTHAAFDLEWLALEASTSLGATETIGESAAALGYTLGMRLVKQSRGLSR